MQLTLLYLYLNFSFILCRLKTWLRSTMGQNRLSGLALLHVHRSININTDKIIDKFSQMKKRNIDFII